MKQSPRFAISSSALIISLALSLFMVQGQIVKPAQRNNSTSGKRQHVATLRLSDSQEGSRVAISSDQSLNNYEAYRRGDCFYVKIPAADVPQAKAVRGRGFADVTAQRSGDSTVLSFRLQPGATAHVERRANKLDVVMTVPGGSPSVTSNRNAETKRSKALDSSRNTGPVNGKASPTASQVNSTTQSQPDLWTRLKERGHDWLLLAQLNPISVAVGAAGFLLIIGLLLVQRRRAKETERVKTSEVEPRKPDAESISEAPTTEPPPESAVAIPAGAPVVPFAAHEIADNTPSPAPVVAIAPLVEERVNQVTAEAGKLFDGADYDEATIGSEDLDTRRLVGAELLSALVGRNAERRDRARKAFMKHGYFDDATRDLRTAESADERAAAARRLSFVHDREATPHLIGALNDPAPEVRRASVEALMDLRDPSAIGPLNSLLQTENDRKVPHTLIKDAIEACATSAPEAMSIAASFAPQASESIETEREVIEI